ncbi:MAG: ATP-dependent DNA helicase RecG [Clostridiales Family XIII bacterium]|jgi:ATP-dependent DNA helicase RecG|nr:ATP-dependent DNA helicase RecG [Clostridiales Family XIII bacterium]
MQSNSGAENGGASLSVSSLKGVGAKKAALLEKLDIHTVKDLLYSFPRTYEDRRNRVTLDALQPGVPAVFRARILSVNRRPAYSPRGKRLPFGFLVADDTGAVEIVFFNAAYLDKIFTKDREFLFFGTPQRNMGKLQIIHPEFEAVAADEAESGRPIVPVYRATAGLTQKDLRRWHEAALSATSDIAEYLPKQILNSAKLCGISYALEHIHFPENRETLSAAKYRLIFEELFILHVGLRILRIAHDGGEKRIRFSTKPEGSEFERLLPFVFTGAQKRVVSEIYRDMESEKPMRRLVQGDVGSGKTAVAAAAIYKAITNGAQAAMMAPTEILAKQHYEELTRFFSERFRVALLTSSAKAAEKREILEGLASGQIDVIVGTHALLRPDVSFAKLGLAVTDEQHRFGVNQRISLSEKGSGSPDVLVMSATPIPRTLAFILYGDLDSSVIDELPPGRKDIITKHSDSRGRSNVYDFALGEMRKGRQIYVVAPLIEDAEGASALRSAESIYEELKGRFRDYRVALLHGNLKSSEKNSIMSEFADGVIDVLVSTVVIEVGVNVKNATMMVIENSERFGLAQLHQLRGRVGRGSEQSWCVLVTDSETEEAAARIAVMTETNDGFVIAEKDLEMRGPGDLFGVRQHGVPELHLADLVRHERILQRVRDEAACVLEADPRLESPENSALRAYIEAQFSAVSDFGI